MLTIQMSMETIKLSPNITLLFLILTADT